MAGQGNNPCLFIYRISSVNSVSVLLVAGVREVWQLDLCVQCQQQRQCEQLERVQCESGAALIPSKRDKVGFAPGVFRNQCRWKEGEDMPSDRNIREYVPGCDRADAACMVQDWWRACISCPLSYAVSSTRKVATIGPPYRVPFFSVTESGE